MAGEDPAYSEWVRSQNCAECAAFPRSNQHHKTGAGMGLRAHDHDSFPLCGSGVRGCHGSFHCLTFGPFTAWTKDRLRDYQAKMVKRYRARYAEVTAHDSQSEVWDDVF